MRLHLGDSCLFKVSKMQKVNQAEKCNETAVNSRVKALPYVLNLNVDKIISTYQAYRFSLIGNLKLNYNNTKSKSIKLCSFFCR